MGDNMSIEERVKKIVSDQLGTSLEEVNSGLCMHGLEL